MVAAARVADFCVVPSDFRFIRVFRVFFDLDPTSLPLDSSKLVGLVRSLARAQRKGASPIPNASSRFPMG